MKFFNHSKYYVLTLLFAFTLGALNAQHRNLTTPQLSQQHEELLAGQQYIFNEISLIDSVAFAEQLKEEEHEFPAFELYGDDWSQVKAHSYDISMDKLAESESIDISDYSMPCESRRITSKYGWRRYRMHRGIDFGIQRGDTIRAAFSGKVRLTRYQRRGYGYYVIIRHHNGLETVYAHLSKFLVKPDQMVKVGDPIALGGNTGRSTGPHLHFETRYLGMDIDPAKIFDFQNGVTHTDTYTFNPKKLAASLGRGKYNGTKAEYSQNAYATHRIRQGDNLSKIAQKYGVTVNQICRLNGISRNTILRPGRVLRVR